MLIPAGYAQVNFRWAGPGVPQGAECTMGLEVPGGKSAADVAQDTADAFGTANVDGTYSGSVRLGGVLAKLGPNATGPQAILSTNVPGLLSANSLAPNTAWLVQKITAVGGRKGRGRLYVPGVPETLTDSGGLITQLNVDNMSAAWNAWAANMVLGGYDVVLLHSDLTAPTPIIQFACSSTVATQRRRLR